MSGARIARVIAAAVSATVFLGGCAVAPLPSAHPRAGQAERDLAWDSRTCGWAAQDASGWDPTLSAGENAFVTFFVVGPLRARQSRQTFDRVYAECMTQRGYDLSSRIQEQSRTEGAGLRSGAEGARKRA